MNFPPGNLVGQLSQPHDAEFVRHIVRGALESLNSYHSRGRSYGQVRPDTIYLAADGRIRLGDVRATIVSTQVEAPEGLSKYLPPEALAAATFGEVGPAVDIYALGLVALELLVGSRFASLFEGVADDPLGGDLAWMRWHGTVESRLPPVAQIVPGIDANLAGLLDHMLSKRVADRPGTAEQALAMLSGTSPLAAPTAPPAVAPPAAPTPAGPSLAATLIEPPPLPSAADSQPSVPPIAVPNDETVRRTTDSASAATIYYEEPEVHEVTDAALDDSASVDSPSQGIAPLPVWHDEAAAETNEAPLPAAPPPSVPPRPAEQVPSPVAATSDEVSPPAAYERPQSAVRGTMIPDDDDSTFSQPSPPASIPAPAAAKATRKPEPPRRGRTADDEVSVVEEMVPAMRLSTRKRRGPLDHPLTLLALSLAIIAGVAYLLFVAWPIDDGTRLVKITSKPPGAKVFINGKVREESTPAEIRLPIGQHDVLVSLDGHYDAAKNLTISKDDKERDIALDLAEIPKVRMVQIATEPSDAAVYLDANPPQAFGSRSPATKELPLGKHTIKIVKAGYLDATHTIDVKLGDASAGPQIETITLSPVPKKIENITVRIEPADAKLTVAGKPVAAPDGKATIPIEEGSQVDLAASADGFAPWTQTLSFEQLRASRFTVLVELDPYVTFTPPEAAVKINDAPVALDAGKVLLPAVPTRSYRIVATAKGYAPLDVTLTRQQLADQKFRVELPPGPRPPASLKRLADGRYVHEKLEQAGAPLYFVVIEPGDFIVGAPDNDIRPGELPRRKLPLDKPYLISTTEVSVKQYAVFAAAEGDSKAGTAWKPANDDEAAGQLPVAKVSFQQAKNFAEFVDGVLPTELQWERAARGTEGRKYPWAEGGEPTDKLCNLNFGKVGGLVAVDALPAGATPDGILNMLGNVAEWCDSKYTLGHQDNANTPGLNTFPVIRGGSYRELYDKANPNARAMLRYPLAPTGDIDVGIRVVVPFVEGK